MDGKREDGNSKMKKGNANNWFMRHKVWTAIIVVIVIAAVASAASGGSSKTSNSTQDSSQPAASSNNSDKASTKDKLAKIGEPVRDGKFEFTVASIKCGEPSVSDSTGYLTKTAQGQYCLLSLSVKNIGNEAQTLDNSSQYVFNSANQKYSSDDQATIYINPSNGTFLNQINPGNTVNGTVVFDIPKGVNPVIAELHDSAFSGGVKVSLQ